MLWGEKNVMRKTVFRVNWSLFSDSLSFYNKHCMFCSLSYPVMWHTWCFLSCDLLKQSCDTSSESINRGNNIFRTLCTVKRTASKLKAICPKMVSFRVVSVLIFGVIELAHCRYYEMNESKQKWDYVTVRQDAHMFWWVYYTTASEGYQNRPLVIWLQVKSNEIFT